MLMRRFGHISKKEKRFQTAHQILGKSQHFSTFEKMTDIKRIKERVEDIFNKGNFVNDIGMRIRSIDVGKVETGIEIQKKHLQQHGFIHMGVQSTMADHTAGMCATTTIEEGKAILTTSFSMNLLRPAIGDSLRCVSTILKAGRNVVFVESEVFSRNKEIETLVSKSTVSLSVVPDPKSQL